MLNQLLNRKILTLTLVAALALAALPVVPTRAQDGGLSGDESALVARALTALKAANGYKSFEATADLAWTQEWTAVANDQVLQSQSVEFSSHEQSRAVASGPGWNLNQALKVTQKQSATNTPDQNYTLEGEVRMVDGSTYVKAAYNPPDPNAPALPQDWYVLADSSAVQVWPGLSILINPEAYLHPNADTVYRLLNVTAVDLDSIFGQSVTGAAAAPGTLDDGTPVDVITLTLNRDGAAAMGLLPGDSTDPTLKMIFEAVTNDPLSLSVLVDASGNLVGITFTLALDLKNMDMSWQPNVPAGLVLNVKVDQTLTVQITHINAALELAAAPELTGQPTTGPAAYQAPAQAGKTFWWNDRVFYEIFVRSFYDSNGDGIGDLRGVIEKLDYLNDGDPKTTTDLGVTGIWLMPIMESPSYHGYDVTDYFTVEPDYGTNQDFKDLVQAAHQRGIAVIVDMVLNHTSNQNPWFIASSKGDPQYADWYIWSDTDPGTRSSSGGQVWHALGGRYYYGYFWEGMPDLNYNTPAVTDEMYKVSQFWIKDMGADGFRLDAIPYLYEDFTRKPPIIQDDPPTLAWLKSYHTFLKSINPDALMVGEVWEPSPSVAPYVGDKVDIAFEFDYAKAIISAAQSANAGPLARTQTTLLETYPFDQYATFLSNHDQNRVMSQLATDQAAAKVAATILLTGPGVPFIYYGEEIGMQGTKPDEKIRTPMQWDDSKPAGGFSTATPWEPMAIGYSRATVAGEASDPDSVYSHYRNLIQLRDAHPALRTGTIQLVQSTNDKVYSFLRYGTDETLLIVVNLGKRDPLTDYSLSIPGGQLQGVTSAELLLGTGDVSAPTIDATGGFTNYVPLASLPPQSSFVIRLH